MKEKSSLILHHDTLGVIDELSDEQAGQLIKEIYKISLYLNNPKNPDEPSGLCGLMNSVLYPFKAQLLRDFDKYKAICVKNKSNGDGGGRPKKHKRTQANPSKPDSDKDKDSDKDSDKRKEKKRNIDTILNYLNSVTKKDLRIETDAHRQYVSARLKEGYSVDDFKKVVDIKSEQWLIDNDMSRHLVPKTLFSPSKFDGYLNESVSIQKEEHYIIMGTRKTLAKRMSEKPRSEKTIAFLEKRLADEIEEYS